MNYTLDLARPEEIADIFSLYEKRIAWMDEVGIRQWNVNGYLEAYPISYYEKRQREGLLYVLKKDGRAVGAAVLLRHDDRWLDRDDGLAWYVHNLVTDPAEKGAGSVLLTLAEDKARANGMRFMRLDCPASSAHLNAFYGSKGYELAGTCEDGPVYRGNRREKAI